MAPEPEEQAPIPPKTHKWKLRCCCVVTYILWVVNIALTALNIHYYYDGMQQECARCYFRSYLLVAIGVSCLSIPLLVLAIPLVVFRMARGIRIYVTILFLATYLELMLGIVLTRDYKAISDVIRIWEEDKSLAFFEDNYKCCGVLGPDDYVMDGRDPPKSCFKGRSGKTKDLYTTGCSTLSVERTAIPFSLIFSLLGQFCMVLALIIYMIILKRTKTPMRTWEWMFPPVRIDVESR